MGLFKEYCSKYDAVEAHHIQSELASMNLAPEVYSRVCRFRTPEGKLSDYGFYTEEAEPLEKCDCGYYCYCSMKTERTRLALCGMVEYWTGWEFVDFHEGNFGYIERDGLKLLAIIDCGHMGFVMEKDMTQTND
jgi:hypothetical protein